MAEFFGLQVRERIIVLPEIFTKKKKLGELLCEDDGSLVDAEQGALGTILGNVSEAVYDNTVSVAQLKSVTGKDLVRELQNYMASYQGTGDSSVDMGRAMQMLKMSRKGYLTESARRKKDLEKEKEKNFRKYGIYPSGNQRTG